MEAVEGSTAVLSGDCEITMKSAWKHPIYLFEVTESSRYACTNLPETAGCIKAKSTGSHIDSIRSQVESFRRFITDGGYVV